MLVVEGIVEVSRNRSVGTPTLRCASSGSAVIIGDADDDDDDEGA